MQDTKIAGVIATNTTIERENLKSSFKTETGGLSGKPLTDKSTEIIKFLHKKSNGSFPIIGVGGINSAKDALEKLKAGASLIQIYTGFVYKGPKLIKDIKKEIVKNYRIWFFSWKIIVQKIIYNFKRKIIKYART